MVIFFLVVFQQTESAEILINETRVNVVNNEMGKIYALNNRTFTLLFRMVVFVHKWRKTFKYTIIYIGVFAKAL